MSKKQTCVTLAVALTAAAALFSPGLCQAGLFDCLSPAPAQAPLTYAPPYQAQRIAYMPTCDPCNPCAAAPQMSYVPEVKYRWKYSRIERTEYQPVAAADPCTGCPVTSYRPVTKKSLLPWLHREAYTTYKPVAYGGATPVSYMQPTYYQPNNCNPCGSVCDPCGSTCDPCGSSSMAAPALSSGGCSSCAGGSSDPGYSQQTFQSGATEWTRAEDSSSQDVYRQPLPDPETQKTDESTESTNGQQTGMPRLIIPQLQPNRTASLQRVRTASYEAPIAMTAAGNLAQAATMKVMPLRLVPIE